MTAGEQSQPATKHRVIGGKGATGIIGASVIAALASLIIQAISARSLSVKENTEYLVFWGLLFGIFGVIAGIQTETTRAARYANLDDEAADERPGARILPIALLLGLLVAVLVLATAGLWAERLVPTRTWLTVAIVALAGIFHAGLMACSGITAGTKQWNRYAGLLGGEAVVRLVLVILVAALAANLVGFEIATALPAIIWLVFLATASGRALLGTRADVDAGTLVRNYLQAMLSSASWAVLVVGFPTLLAATSPAEDPRILATTILAVTLTRSPIMMPLQAFQGVVIARVAGEREGNPMRTVRNAMALLLAVGVVGAGLAVWLGPPLMVLIFGPDYAISGAALGWLMIAAVSMAWLVLTGACALALNLHRYYAVGWLAGLALTIGLLIATPGDVQLRSIVSLAVGPLLGVAIELLAIYRGTLAASSAR